MLHISPGSAAQSPICGAKSLSSVSKNPNHLAETLTSMTALSFITIVEESVKSVPQHKLDKEKRHCLQADLGLCR